MNQTENGKFNLGFYSVCGLSHDRNGTECQDALGVLAKNDHGVEMTIGPKTKQIPAAVDSTLELIAVISDGLGSKEFSREASHAAVGAVIEFLYRNHQSLSPENAAELLREPLLTAAKEAVARIEQGRPMDCNLAFLLISGDHAYIGHLGDCAVCVLDSDPLARTTQGAIANATRTVLTSDPEDLKVEVLPLSDALNGFILTTDGLEGEIYRKNSGWINKVTESYYNPVASAPTREVANSVLERRISALRKQEGDLFSDDISIIVVSCNQKDILLEDDPTWRCTCGNRNPIHVPYCPVCKQDRLKVYPYDELLREGQPNLDRFVRDLAKNPLAEQAYLERAAARLGVAPPKPPAIPQPEPAPRPLPEPVPTPKPAPAPKPEPTSKPKPGASTPRTQSSSAKPKSRRGGSAQPEKDRPKAPDNAGPAIPTSAYTGVTGADTGHTPPPTEPKPVKTKPKVGTWLIVAGIVIAFAVTGVLAWMLLTGSGEKDPDPVLSGLKGDYVGQMQSNKPDGIGVQSDDGYLWVGVYHDGERTDDSVRVDSIGIMAPDGKYIYTWNDESQDPAGSSAPAGTTRPPETTLPTETTEPTDPVTTTAPPATTEPENPNVYPEGTTFTVLQKLNRGRQDPHSTMPAQLDLKAGDTVTALGDPTQTVDNIVWIRIKNKNGDIGWVDMSYLQLLERP